MNLSTIHKRDIMILVQTPRVQRRRSSRSAPISNVCESVRKSKMEIKNQLSNLHHINKLPFQMQYRRPRCQEARLYVGSPLNNLLLFNADILLEKQLLVTTVQQSVT